MIRLDYNYGHILFYSKNNTIDQYKITLNDDETDQTFEIQKSFQVLKEYKKEKINNKRNSVRNSIMNKKAIEYEIIKNDLVDIAIS